MINKVTKKATEQLANIIKTKGYWSAEVKEFLSNYDYSTMERINNKAKLLASKGVK